MTISAKVIAHSRSPFHNYGVSDALTFLLRYPRFIHAEVLTHRVFSRNASSSRAIPVNRLIQDVIDDTAMPIHWGKNQSGMQAFLEHDAEIEWTTFVPSTEFPGLFEDKVARAQARAAWMTARDNAIDMARAFARAGYHKQIVNRILEPFAHINVVVTATNYDNFYWLRDHADAQPEIKKLAGVMLDAHRASTPRLLRQGEWHMPFVTDEDRARPGVTIDELLQVSTARCARTSYMTHDNRVPVFDEDAALFHRLVGAEPLHASPTEHQCRADEPLHAGGYDNEHLSGNLDAGWIQFRKTLPGEFHRRYEPLYA